MSIIHKPALLVALVAGLGLGGMASYLQPEKLSPEPAALSLSNAQVSPHNTAGFPALKSGDFDLIDQNGKQRTSVNPLGHHQLVFFGYAKCKAVCSIAIPNMAETVDLLDGMQIPVTPVMITVDPQRDTVTALKQAVPQMHPKMQGLTGDQENLDAAYKTFNLEKKFLFDHPDEGPVYAHGSFIYLLDPKGKFKTLFAPVTSPVRMAEIAAGYIVEDNKQ